jgi:uncharacterized protein
VPYFDTSVIVAYYLPELLSSRVQAIYDAHASPATSELVEVEFFSTLSLRVRVGDLAREQADRVGQLFVSHLDSGLYARIHLTADHYRQARDFLARFDLPLKSPDAVHLAVSSAAGLTLVTADAQLGRNAEALGIAFDLVGHP